MTPHVCPAIIFSYHGAQIFEIYGLGPEVVEAGFRGSVSRIGGLTLDEVSSPSLPCLPA